MSWLGRVVPGLALGLAVIAAAGVVLAGPGYRFGWWGLGPAFALLRSSAELALGAGAVAVVAIVVGGAQRSRRPLGLGILALAIALAAFGIPWRMQAQRVASRRSTTSRPTPRIRPRSWRSSPVARARGTRWSTAAPRWPLSSAAPFLTSCPWIWPRPPSASSRRPKRPRGVSGWEIVAAVPAEGRLEATATTPWFGFKDDVVVRVRGRGPGTRVDVRSLSRVGVGDLGVNAARVRAFLDRLRASGLPPA